MPETFIPSVISIIGILISVSVSVFVTRQQSKIELEKIKKHLEQEYAKSLFDKRVETYPQLYNLLSDYNKKILYNQQTARNLLEFRDAVDKWNSQYSFFFTGATSILSWRFRKYLKALLANGDNSQIQEGDWKTIRRILGHFERAIRSEIGVTSIEPASNIEGIDDVYKFIEESTQEREVF
jgi:hypothetical protein